MSYLIPLISLFMVFQSCAVVIEGVSEVDMPASPEQKQAAIELALVDGIDKHFKSNEPDLLPLYSEYVTPEQLIKRIPDLITNYGVVSADEQQGKWITAVRANFNIDFMKTLLGRFSVVSRTDESYRSAFAVVFVGRERTESGYMPVQLSPEVEAEVSRVFQQNNFTVLTDYQFNSMSGGVFNHSVLSSQFVQKGSVDWRQGEVAASMSNTGADAFYMVVGTYELHYEGSGDFEPVEWYQVKINGEVINPVGYKSLTATSRQLKQEDMDKQEARRLAVIKAARQVATGLSDNLLSAGIY